MTHKPSNATAKEAAQYIVGKKNIMILTGAGLSAASGIPTFRGANGFWKQQYEGYSDPEEILKMTTFTKDPHIVWKWHYDFIKLMKACKPNDGHRAIQDLIIYTKQKNSANTCLVTQNIDNYHTDVLGKVVAKTEGTKEYAFTDNIYEIHGNVLYMFCITSGCSKEKLFMKCPDNEEMPLCKECGKPMKPHAMFFDEQYSEELYKSETVRNFVENKMDALIVVGTALQTSYAKMIVNKALLKLEIPVIEVNIESCIPAGFRILVSEPSEKSLPAMVSEYKRIAKL
ncbi:hypothetical protein FGO68_gene9628 [Halteria grandinella]|uniref:Deacetylase sirtuin-type domain-containing protein n=1 Tax=Halteria grandinella TaxID=5974 RepID=A0A8J8NDP3_HALGN|nr:hypothetical protein FGO68_gene9628 [Halteria grandinella]